MGQPEPGETFAPPDWTGEAGEHLEKLRVYAETKIEQELEWYRRNKRIRSKTSQRLRFWSVCFTILGGLVPVVVAATSETPPFLKGLPIRFGQLGYVLLGIAGGLVLMDRYFGYSTGWMRYVLAMQAIEKAREVFRLDWTALLRVLSTTPQGSAERLEAVDRMIQRVRAVVIEVKERSERETQDWIAEFQSNLAQLEKDIKSQQEANRPGGVDVEVTDGRKADTPVEIMLDGMTADRFVGTTGSIGFVSPGMHRITARAQKDDKDFSSSIMLNVNGGQIASAKLTLGM
jgi:hypothetical protein